MRMWENHRVLGIALILALAGCGAEVPAPFPELAPKPEPYHPTSGSGNAFDFYVRAAQGVATLGPAFTAPVTFSAGQRERIIVQLLPDKKLVLQGSAYPCTFEFQPHRPFENPPYRQGWRMLGRAMAWQIQDSIEHGKLDQAITGVILATRFGFDLSTGDAADSTLGLIIVDTARQAIAPYLGRLNSGQLHILNLGLQGALSRFGDPNEMFEHEHLNMTQAVQSLQDHFRDNTLKQLSDQVGVVGQEPFKKLAELYGQDSRKRLEFFQELLGASAEELAWLKEVAPLPAISRSTVPSPEYPKAKRWRGFVKLFFNSARPVLGMRDATVARSRLLCLQIELLSRQKLGQPLPRDMNAFSPQIRMDPFSGKPFMYHRTDGNFSVYSVGENGADDMGATDESFSSPDLRLEAR